MSLPIATDENDSRLLKSRLPSKTLICGGRRAWYNLQCPLRKGIIYYRLWEKIFEHDLYSSSENEPRMIATLRQVSMSISFTLIPINRNRILLIGKCHEESYYDDDYWDYLRLSIHGIHSYRVGPALWTYDHYGHSNIFELQPMKSTTNALGITFGVHSESHMELFDISTDAKKGSYPLVEAGKLNYGRKLNKRVVLSPDRHILLHANQNRETIDVFYSGTGDTDNMDFSFVTHVSIPNPKGTNRKDESHGAPLLAFSANGAKFAVATSDGVVWVWDVRCKIPLKVFEADMPRDKPWSPWGLQFSSGILGREVLVFMAYEASTDQYLIHLIDATSFETEEILWLIPEPTQGNKFDWGIALFFEPSGSSMYASRGTTLYEWNLRKNTGPEWWLEET